MYQAIEDMMELKKAPKDANMPEKKPGLRVLLASAVLVSGLTGCFSSSPPPRSTTTICESYGVPPRNPAREEMPAEPYSEAEMALMQPPYAYMKCVTVEER